MSSMEKEQEELLMLQKKKGKEFVISLLRGHLTCGYSTGFIQTQGLKRRGHVSYSKVGNVLLCFFALSGSSLFAALTVKPRRTDLHVTSSTANTDASWQLSYSQFHLFNYKQDPRPLLGPRGSCNHQCAGEVSSPHTILVWAWHEAMEVKHIKSSTLQLHWNTCTALNR